MLIATGAAIVAGPFVQDWFNNEMTGLGTAITDALTAPMPWDGLPSFNLHNELNVSTSVNTYFNAARPLDLPHDPLALDLDGDGIETIGVGTVLFDHNGDGIRTGTGWLKGDDGFLVLDRNGNGVIDNGGELFGVDTIKSNGQRATDGFDALRDLDSNGDGIFDANDEQFSNVRVWRDLNQDGISQANELFTLEQLGIASINLTPTTTNVALGGGNTQTALGTFARSDGSTGAVGNAAIDDGAAANLNLAQNPFYREFTDPIELTEATQNLPEMHGSGAVRDLREAATLNTNLAAALSSVQTAGTREALDAQLNTIIVEWAKSADFPSTLERLTTGRAQASPFMARISETNVTGAESAPPIRGEEAPSLGRFTAMDGFQSYYQLPDSFVVSDEMIAWA
ncbi:MAG: hypothetical protein FWD62_13290 [Betaproteobacteria bacterium]|nr:hypothetical protein [Betaproteobacteria bacterium]